MSSGGTNSSGKVFDFGSDDVLCSPIDVNYQEPSHGEHMDYPSLGSYAKDVQGPRVERSLLNLQIRPEESSFQDVISVVERTMKSYADTLLQCLEGISGRLCQLESCCSNLEQCTGKLRSDLAQHQITSDQNIRSLEKHLQEVHRAVQIIRDKQELADTRKELARLQFKHTDSAHPPDQHEDDTALAVRERKQSDSSAQAAHQQPSLSLALQSPREALPQQPVSTPQQTPFQPSGKTHHPHQKQIPGQTHATPLEHQYASHRSQVQEQQNHLPFNPSQHQSSSIARHSYSSFQQWPQHMPVPQGTNAAPVRVQSPSLPYPGYPDQSLKVSSETFPGNTSSQVPFSIAGQPDFGYPGHVGYGYHGSDTMLHQPQIHQNVARQPQLQPPLTSQGPPGSNLGEFGYRTPGLQPPQPNYRYSAYGARGPYQPSQLPQTGYSQQAALGVDGQHSNMQLSLSHPHAELLEKALTMGYAREQVVSALRRMEETNQPLDFNTLLDYLNGIPQRGW